MLKTRILTGSACAAALIVAACQPMAPPGGGGNTEMNDNSGLPQAQTDAIRAAFETATAVGAAGAGAFPSADVTAFVDGFGAMGPTCPAVDFDLIGEPRSVALDYGDTCSPVLFPATDVGGVISGTISLDTATASLSFDAFVLDDQTIDGTLSASLNRDAPLSTFDATIELVVSDTGAIDGDVLVTVDTDSGAVTIPEGTVNATTDSGHDIAIEFDMVVIQPVDNGNFFPQSGTLTFTLEAAGAPPVRVVMTFDENTPVQGSVNYSIDVIDEMP